MSLPSLKDVLRSISHTPGAGSTSRASRERGNNNAGTASNLRDVGQQHKAEKEEKVRISKAAVEEAPASGGQRRRRHEVEVMSDGNNSDWDSVNSPGTHSNYPSSPSPGGHSWGGSVSWEGSDHRDGSTYSQQSWDGASDLNRRLVVTPNGGGSSNGQKRARLQVERRSLSHSLPSEHERSTLSNVGSAGHGGRAGGGQDKVGLTRSASLLRQGYGSTSQSHSTAEWKAFEKAARVLGVDSLEERDVEERQRFSTRKVAQLLGVDNVEEVREMQETAAGGRQKWAPPRSSQSKVARTLGCDDSELQVQPKSRYTSRSSSQRQSSTVSSNRSKDSKDRNLSFLIHAMEINDSQQQVGDPRQSTGSRSEVETGSAYSTQSSITHPTESCTGSDLTLPDPDGSAARASGSGNGSGRIHGTNNKPELSDDQMAGLQTPAQIAAAEAHANGGCRYSRDDMEIETPPSQPRSAALTSLRKAPAPLLAPYTPSVAGANRSSPSTFGPGPSPAGSPLGSARLTPGGVAVGPSPVLTARHVSDHAVGSGGGERSPAALSMKSEGKGGGGRIAGDKLPALAMVAEGKGRSPVGSEALGDEGDGGSSSGWARPSSAPLPAPVPVVTSVSTVSAAPNVNSRAAAAAHNRGQQISRANPDRRVSPPATPAPSPITPATEWGSGWSAPPAYAGAKETQPTRGYVDMEYKQDSPVRPAAAGEWGQPPANLASLSSSRSSEYSPYGQARGSWRSPHDSFAAEFKHESNGPAPGVGIGRGGWLAPPARPSSAPVPGIPQQHLQPPHLSRSFSPSSGQMELSRPIPPPPASGGGGGGGGFSVGVTGGRATGGSPTSYERRTYGSESSGEAGSDSTGDSSNADRMDDSDSLPVRVHDRGGGSNGSFSALAALIPFINPSVIGAPVPGVTPVGLPTVVKQEVGRAGAAPTGAEPPAAKPKSRRRVNSGKVNPSAMDVSHGMRSSVVAVSPVNAMTQGMHVAGNSAAGNHDQPMDVGSTSGISTRKQQEVATRPREKGRFVKRPPAFIAITAFKPANDRTEADIAAERAEEAREEAVEAAARAAAAAVAAAGKKANNASSASSSSSSSMSSTPPIYLAALGPVAGCGSSKGEQAAPWATVGESEVRGYCGEASGGGKHERRGASPGGGAESRSPAASSTRTGRAGFVGGGGRGRSERAASPPPRTPHTDIWTGHDSEGAVGQGSGAGPAHDSPVGGSGGIRDNRDRSVSDCGSERGSDDLRGMQFLPFSPVGGEGGVSPRSSWDSPRRSVFSANGSAVSTPSSGRQRSGGYHTGGRAAGMHSPRPVPSFSSDGDSVAPWAGDGSG